MNRALSGLFLLSAATISGLGNFWFTYGIWPRSWWSFVGFSLIGSVISVLLSRWIKNED